MEEIEKKLDELEEAITDAKEEQSKLGGMLETLLKQMEERFGVTTVEDAAELLQDIQKKMEKSQKELDKKYAELRDSYEW